MGQKILSAHTENGTYTERHMALYVLKTVLTGSPSKEDDRMLVRPHLCIPPPERQGCAYHITAALATRAHDGKGGMYVLERKCPLTRCGGLLELCVRTCGLHNKGST